LWEIEDSVGVHGFYCHIKGGGRVYQFLGTLNSLSTS
jgi:hypothetical protein